MIPDPGRKNEQIRMNHAINSATASPTRAAVFAPSRGRAVVNCFVCIYFAFGGVRDKSRTPASRRAGRAEGEGMHGAFRKSKLMRLICRLRWGHWRNKFMLRRFGARARNDRRFARALVQQRDHPAELNARVASFYALLIRQLNRPIDRCPLSSPLPFNRFIYFYLREMSIPSWRKIPFVGDTEITRERKRLT